jgi:hypothetical protein
MNSVSQSSVSERRETEAANQQARVQEMRERSRPAAQPDDSAAPQQKDRVSISERARDKAKEFQEGVQARRAANEKRLETADTARESAEKIRETSKAIREKLAKDRQERA